MANQINPQSIIPEHWRGIYVSSSEDLIFLGRANLYYLKQYWRGEEWEAQRAVKDLQVKIDLLKDKGADGIKAVAAGYKNPSFPNIGQHAYNNGQREPEPLDAGSINREYGTTTFNVCGWCKYRSSPQLCIATTCSLVPREFSNVETCGSIEKLRFNTPCLLANGTQELLDICAKYLESQKTEIMARKSRFTSYARYLTRIGKDAEEKPVLANHRPYDWFNLGDEVLLLHGYEDTPEMNGQFVTGKVVNGYRHHDGCVSVVADKKVHDNMDNHNGCGLGLGICRPEIVHKWEYEYLKANPDFFKVWLRASESDLSYNFDPTKLRAAMAN